MNEEPDLSKDIEVLKKGFLNRINKIYRFIASKNPIIRWGLVLFIVITPISWKIYQESNKVLGSHAQEEIAVPNINIQEDVLEKDRIENKCNGAIFEIPIGGLDNYFETNGKEIFFDEGIGVSARNTEYYQASVKTKWLCKLPFVAKVVAVPMKGPSFGLFFEGENAFRVLVGDGDRKTLKVEENKWGPRGAWQTVKDENGNDRQYLGNPIEDGEEVTLIVKAKADDKLVHLRVEVHHSKFQSVEIFNYSFLPNAVNLSTDQGRKFHIGINDFGYKGEGSIIDFKNF